MYEVMIALILKIAAEVGIPPYFALAVAQEENCALNPNVMSAANTNGTVDLGIMQLNSRYYGEINWRDPETNIRAGCMHIKALIDDPAPGLNTYWAIAVVYNCGIGRFLDTGPPLCSIEYGNNVIKRWNELTNGNAAIILEGKQ